MTESRRVRLSQGELEEVLGTAYGKDEWDVSQVILRCDNRLDGSGDGVVEYPEGCDVVFIPRVQIPPIPQEEVMAYPLPTATPFVSQTSVSVVEDDDVPF